MSKTAIVIGATGLVGRALTRRLLSDERYGCVKVLARRRTGLVGATLEEHLVDFNDIDHWRDVLTGDELFSALGTTRKQAGSKEVQWRVDYTYQYDVARRAAEGGVTALHLISSAGADSGAKMFYSRMKGELEKAVVALPFARVVIYQPSLLVGRREQSRAGERAAEIIMTAVTWLPGVRRYRAISGDAVARAMITVANRPAVGPVERYTLDEIHLAASTVMESHES